MTRVFSAHAVSVDGYIAGRDPGAGRGRVNEVILHQVPVLLRLAEAVPTQGVTHLHYEIER